MRTTVSIYCQLDNWIESVDAAYAAHPELLAATPAFPVTSTSETSAHMHFKLCQRQHTSLYPQSHLYFCPATTILSHKPPSLASPAYLPDQYFFPGIHLALGMFHLALSLVPGKLQALVELCKCKVVSGSTPYFVVGECDGVSWTLEAGI